MGKYLKKYLSYNSETGVLTWLVVCGRGRPGASAGALEAKGYIRLQVLGKRILAHRIAWYFIHGKMPNHQVDHINGNKADNRAINLRAATNAQNQANRGKNKNNTSGFKGVCWRKDSKKWSAQISCNGKKIKLGSYHNIEDAVAAYEAAAKRLFGDFAST